MVRLFLRGEPLFSAGNPAEIQAVLLDKDGTMSKSEPHLLDLASTRIRHGLCLAREMGLDHLGELEDFLRKAYGLHSEGESLDPAGITAVASRDHNLISTAVAFTLVGQGWPDSLHLAQECFRLADLAHPSVTAQLTDGLMDFLDALQLSGVPPAVISNDDTDGIQSFLRHHGLSRQISAIWSADHQPRKPDPQAVRALCKRLSVSPEHCALIGDANSDLRMARAAGVAVVLGYGGGWQRPVALDTTYPCFDHWDELSVEESRLKPDQRVSMETWGDGNET